MQLGGILLGLRWSQLTQLCVVPPTHRRILVRAPDKRLALVRSYPQAEERLAAAVGAPAAQLGHLVCHGHQVQHLQRMPAVSSRRMRCAPLSIPLGEGKTASCCCRGARLRPSLVMRPAGRGRTRKPCSIAATNHWKVTRDFQNQKVSKLWTGAKDMFGTNRS